MPEVQREHFSQECPKAPVDVHRMPGQPRKPLERGRHDWADLGDSNDEGSNARTSLPNRGRKDAQRKVMEDSLQASMAKGGLGTGALEGPPHPSPNATAVRADPAHTSKGSEGSEVGAQGGPLTDDIPDAQLPRPPEMEWSEGAAGDDDTVMRDIEIIEQSTLPRPPEGVNAQETKDVTTDWTEDQIEEAVTSAQAHLNPADLEGLRMVREYATMMAMRARRPPPRRSRPLG